MSLYPVIMCGGSGTRLWPASRPSRPKQFIPLSGNRSLFQETVVRVAPLAVDGGRIVVIGGAKHRRAILDQLHQIGIEAKVLLEPEGRDSAAAMAAAAHWTLAHDPEGVNVFVASDHHMPDHAGFQQAVMAASVAAAAGRIVTLGIRPTEPSEAYGYIRSAGRGLSPIAAFVEKPSRVLAEHYIAEGYLWNSGNFIARADVVISELKRHAPGVEHAALASIRPVLDGVNDVLGPAFRDAPKISIDYAIMEKTSLASVLEVEFKLSDLGSWDAIAATGEGEFGGHIFEDAEGCMARAPDGMIIAALGVKNLAIVAEKDAVLVCDLSRAQEVRRVVERIRVTSPLHADFPQDAEENLAAGAARLGDWLRLRALPLWATIGQLDNGAFVELLSLEGRRVPATRCARVQALQICAFAQAGLLGWQGPWRVSVERGLDHFATHFMRADAAWGVSSTAVGEGDDGASLMDDQALLLLTWATAAKVGVRSAALQADAARLRDQMLALSAFGDEGSSRPNIGPALLSAAVAWAEQADDPVWLEMARALAKTSLRWLLVPENSQPQVRGASQVDDPFEPGRQFAWASILARYSNVAGDAGALPAARDCYARGRRGLDLRGQVIVDLSNNSGGVLTERARLRPQLEWLKAALTLAEVTERNGQFGYLADAELAQRAVWLYLTPGGLWRDKRLEKGNFIDEAVPANTLHLVMDAFRQMSEGGILGGNGKVRLMLH